MPVHVPVRLHLSLDLVQVSALCRGGAFLVVVLVAGDFLVRQRCHGDVVCTLTVRAIVRVVVALDSGGRGDFGGGRATRCGGGDASSCGSSSGGDGGFDDHTS